MKAMFALFNVWLRYLFESLVRERVEITEHKREVNDHDCELQES